MTQMRWRGALALSTVVFLLVLSGCIRVTTQFVVQPDGGTQAKVLMGMDERLNGTGEASGTPMEGLTKGPQAKYWKVREYKEGGWAYTEAVGKVPAGEPVFGEDKEGPTLKCTKSEHRLSTRYRVTMTVPPVPSSVTSPVEAEEKPEIDVKGLEAMTEGLLSSVQIRFQVGGPGRVVSTTGKIVGEGLAEWTPAVSALSDKNAEPMVVVTEAANWVNLGRLADRIAYECGMDDAGVRLGQALRQGLLPNPPMQAKEADSLTAVDYFRLLEVIRKLAAVAPTGRLGDLVGRLGLNADQVTGRQILAAYERVNAADFAAHVDNQRVRDLEQWFKAD